MSSSTNWKQVAAVAAGTATAGALLWYLLREEKEEVGAETKGSTVRGAAKEPITVETVVSILSEIHLQQVRMKSLMRELSKLRQAEETPFKTICEKVKELQLNDPLTKHGLDMADFDAVLEANQHDERVREGVFKLMAPSPPAPGFVPKSMTMDQVVEVHQLMADEISKLSGDASAAHKASYEPQAITFAAQVVVGAKVEKQLGWTTEDVEASVGKHAAQLEGNQRFIEANEKLQMAMQMFMAPAMQ